jgi:aminopeptidase S
MITMRSAFWIPGVVLCLLFVLAGPGFAQTDVSASFVGQANAIASGADSKARGTAIIKRLDELGIKHRIEAFTYNGRAGENIVAELPAANATAQLMLGAHYDRVSQGQGAVDNASGSAAVLELLASLKKKPLREYAVTAAFFDLEEVGLRGSADYVKVHSEKGLPAIFINFDVFGYGDTLWVMSSSENALADLAVKQAARAAKFPLQIGSAYPPSDHLSFARAKVETLSFSLIDGMEIPAILKVFSGERPEKMPRVLTIIHSSNDTPDKIDGPAVARALLVVEEAIRLMQKVR